MTVTISPPYPTAETISVAKERRERKKRSQSPAQRRPRAIDMLPTAASPPSRTFIPLAGLRRGRTAGWLKVESTPASLESPIRVRCECGAVTTPVAKFVSTGATRSCGDLSLHGLF